MSSKGVSILLIAAAVIMSSCNKEDSYNADGSPITMEQALDIVKDEVEYYEWVEISTEVIKRGTTFTNALDITCGTYKVPYDSWVIMFNTAPLFEGGQYWLYIYVNAHTGATDKRSMLWGVPDEFETVTVKAFGTSKPLTPDDIFPSFGSPAETKADASESSDN